MKNKNSFWLYLGLISIIYVSGCGGCNNCPDAGNDDTKLTLLVDFPLSSSGGCLYDNYPYYFTQGTGYAACCIFTDNFGYTGKHYIELTVSGLCYGNAEFSKTFKGAIDDSTLGYVCPGIFGSGCSGDNGDIEIYPYSDFSTLMKLCVDVPRSLHHGYVDYNISLTYRTECSGLDDSCDCPQGQHYYGYYRHEGLMRHEAENGNFIQTECTIREPIYYVDSNSFSSFFTSCSTDDSCLP